MSVSEPSEVAAARQPSSRRRKWLIRALVFLLPVSLVAGVYAYVAYAEKREVKEAVAEADGLDPGWRLEELDAKRKDMPDQRNAALRVLSVKQLMPSVWPGPLKPAEDGSNGLGAPDANPPKTVYDLIEALSPEVQLTAALTAQVREDLRAAAVALAEARKLAEIPEGRYPLTYSLDFISTHSYCQDARSVTHMLRLDVMLLAQDGEPNKALASVRAMFNAARSIGDEPLSISQLVRNVCRSVAIGSLERVLAQSQPSDIAVMAVQKILDEEDAHPGLLIAARGERAGAHAVMKALESGDLSVVDFMTVGETSPPTAQQRGDYWMASRSIPRAHAWIIRWENEAAEIAKMPSWQRGPRLTGLEKRIGDAPLLASNLIRSWSQMAEADQRGQAQVRSALAAIAVERYRREKGSWPDSLAVLEAKQLPKVPLDPFDGQPLRYLILGDGVVVYSVGMDGKDDGGNLDRKSNVKPGTDIGFRLWNREHRRQPPTP